MISAQDSVALSMLTRRQREVLRLVAHGYSDAQIGERLGIRYLTVTNHVDALRRRLKLHSRVLLTLYALKAGLVSSGEITLPGHDL